MASDYNIKRVSSGGRETVHNKPRNDGRIAVEYDGVGYDWMQEARKLDPLKPQNK